MATPRPKPLRRWTWDDHQENEQRLRRDADQKLWAKLGRLIGVRGTELKALLARFMDDRIAAGIRAHCPPLLNQLQTPALADALRNAIGDLMADDIASMVQILTSQGNQNDARDEEETSGSGGEDAANGEREISDGEAHEWKSKELFDE